MKCECDERKNRYADRCDDHEDCDDFNCRALRIPQTLEEYKIALNHWREHSYLSGCSHGS